MRIPLLLILCFTFCCLVAKAQTLVVEHPKTVLSIPNKIDPAVYKMRKFKGAVIVNTQKQENPDNKPEPAVKQQAIKKEETTTDK